MQGWYIGITAASQAVKAGSIPVPCSKNALLQPAAMRFSLRIQCASAILGSGGGTP